MPSTNGPTLLLPYRVLDLTTVMGHLCGKVLAEMGADVIKIEPPGGDSARDLGPFVDDIPHRNRSLTWFAFNPSKRGVTLSLETADGRDLFLRLVQRADFVVESFKPGYLDSLGLGYDRLKAIKPDLILTSITPFGQSGPYRGYEAPDLVLMAMGGFMGENGYPDSPPVRMSVDQAYHHGGFYGAAASLTAHLDRVATGQGQHIDVSIQEALTLMFDPSIQNWVMMKEQGTNRVGPKMRRGKVLMRLVWPCKDGYATWRLFTGQPVGRRTHKIIDWAEEDGQDTGLKGTRWQDIDMLSVTQEQLDDWDQVFGEFFLRHTKEQLVEGALSRRMMIYPVNTIADALSQRHFAEREFFTEIDHPELGRTVRYPGPYWKSPGAPWRAKGRAPLIGEHNREVYGEELGLSREDLAALKASGVI
ncbi:MAG: CoA transferase [Dehalococcoidia bacterium]